MNNSELSFRSKSALFLNSKYFFFAVAISCLGLSIFFGAAGYFLGFGVVLITSWANKWNWRQFGFKKTVFSHTLLLAVGISIALYIVLDGLIQPLVELYFGDLNLDAFEGIKGNLPSFLILLAIMWVTAAFGEELFYRGYLMNRLAKYFGNKNESWFLAAAISAAYFGLAHLYQGWSGVITTGIGGFVLGLLFMKKRSLWLPILVHGTYDMIGITFIYLGKESWVADLFHINF